MKIRIRGTEIALNEQQRQEFESFKEYDTTSQQIHDFDQFPLEHFQRTLEIMELAEYSFPDFPMIKTKNLNEVIGEKLGNHLKKFTINELSELHNVCNFFGCTGVRKVVTAALGCHFYFVPTPSNFRLEMQKLNLKSYPSIETIKKYRQRFRQLIN